MDEQNIIDVEEANEAIEEIEKVGFMEKAVCTIEKHGKKILVFVGMVTVGLIVHALGHRGTDEDYEGYATEDEMERTDITDESNNE